MADDNDLVRLQYKEYVKVGQEVMDEAVIIFLTLVQNHAFRHL
jgi:hypothetical protein